MSRTTTDRASFAVQYAEIQNFYARHFHLLDTGRAEEWAQTFTADGFFHPEVLPEPVRGHAALTAGLRRTHTELVEKGEQRRHWHGMIAVTPRDENNVSVRCYALIFSTLRGGPSTLRMSCVCEDILVRSGGEWKIRERKVTRDDRTGA